MTIGNRIRKLRENSQMTQSEVAKKIGVATQTVFKYENGIISNIPSDKLQALSLVFNVSIDYILGVTISEQTNASINEIKAQTGLSDKAIINVKRFCVGEPFGMQILNQLLEELEPPYDSSVLYDVIELLYIIENKSAHEDYFVLCSNGTLQKTGYKSPKLPTELTRVSQSKLMEDVLLESVIKKLHTGKF